MKLKTFIKYHKFQFETQIEFSKLHKKLIWLHKLCNTTATTFTLLSIDVCKILNRILIVDNKVENQLQYFQAFDAVDSVEARNVIPMKFWPKCIFIMADEDSLSSNIGSSL